MFVFIWGSTNRTEVQGMVADQCPQCQAVRPFVVTAHYRVGHIYFIPLGRGTFQGSTYRCTDCRGERYCDADAFDEVLPRSEAQALSVGELLGRTNSALEQRLRVLQKLEQQAQQPDVGDGDEAAAAQQRLAMARLREIDDGSAPVSAYLNQLLSWHQLSPFDRQRLLDEIDTLVGERKRLNQAFAFIQTAAQDCPTEAAGVLTGLLGVVLVVLLIALLAALGLDAWVGLAGVVGVVALCVLFYRRVRGFPVRGWWRKKFIPRAEEQGIDYELLLHVLAQLARSSQRLGRVRRLTNSLHLYVEVLREMDHLPEGGDSGIPDREAVGEQEQRS